MDSSTANYEELKENTKSILQIVTSNNLYYGLFLLAVMLIVLKIIDLIFKPFGRNQGIFVSFVKGCLKVFVVCTIGFRICSLVPGLKDFTSQILMSSSLIVVVLGFVFQEGLTNIVHGLILSMFHPFKIGDRIRVTIDGEQITGYVRAVNARQTVIENVLNSSHVIVPNSKMDTCIIDNNYYDGNQTSSSFLDLSITYESDLQKACRLIAEEVSNHPLVVKERARMKNPGEVTVMVRALGESGIDLRCTVVTQTVEENFAACSDIRRALVLRFAKEKDLDFAYPHMQLVNHTSADEDRA